MKTLVCPTCSCSLVRLGIQRDKAVPCRHNGEEHFFCCQGCVDVFATDPKKYFQESRDWIVCPTCLAEKPQALALRVEIPGGEVYFCRCPYCAELFQKNPDFYMQRLEGIIPNEGVLDHEGCCVRPE